jgi:hypothetical protein
MASIIGKLKKETKNKIIHSTFELGRSVLDALEEQMIAEPEAKENDKQ